MAELTYRDAVAAGIAQEMERDERVVFLGEDVAAAGGVFKATVGLLEKFGPKRVRDCPISEQAILGAAMGAAMTGLRPIAEIMFSDFLAVCWDIVANEIAKTRYMTNGQITLPLVIRTANGAGSRFGAQHSQAVENWAMAVPGLKVVAPAFPRGRERAARRGGARSGSGAVFRAEIALLDEGRSARRRICRRTRQGDGCCATARDCTIVALASMVHRSLEAANYLEKEHGISCTVVDVRSLVPLDTQTILAEVAKTGQAGHGRGKPAAVRLGRGDRLDRRRRMLLGPRRADPAHHHAACPAALGRSARGQYDSVGGAYRARDPG